MRKRGFVSLWQNKHWAGKESGFGMGQKDPNILPGGSGPLPNFLTFGIRGRGYGKYWDDDKEEYVRYLKEISFVSPPFRNEAGRVYRFLITYTRRDEAATAAMGYFMIAECFENGMMYQEPLGTDTTWDSTIGKNTSSTMADILYQWNEKADWNTITSILPTVELNAYNMMINDSNRIFEESKESQTTGYIQGESFSGRQIEAKLWNTPPLLFERPSEGVAGIIQRALSLSSYKYWYGGAGQVATQQLANSLRAAYPSIWTATYYEKALKDVGQNVGDCSYLVNYAYGKASPGNHGPGTGSYLSTYTRLLSGGIKDGMIVWRNGHCGIYYQGNTIELVGIDYDYQERPYNASSWSAILYDRNIQY